MSFNTKLPDDREAKENILEAGRRMFDKSYCAANDGNISVRTAEGNFWVTPSGVSKGFMDEDMLIKIDMDGNVLEQHTDLHISSEINLHLAVYRNRPDVNAVVHAHPPLSTAFACARKPMTEPVVNEAVLNLGEVPCAPFALPGTRGLADSIVPYLQGHAAVLLANHGAVTWGESMEKAYFRLETLEYYAKMLILTGLGPKAHLLDDDEKKGIESRRESYGIVL
ncbi:MAG: class II aldolase/adducin family protein [Anaerovoracaceae bacterium]|nr:class II aldolase/adducin family protein [Bacillota bacterium]MDY2670070.1 class II aldolase/adducin family protein [Anaerovoracaceae bacterium]